MFTVLWPTNASKQENYRLYYHVAAACGYVFARLMGFSFSKQELFIKITIFLVLFTRALHCSTFRKKSCGQLASKFSFLVTRVSILVAKSYTFYSSETARFLNTVLCKGQDSVGPPSNTRAHQLLSKKGIKVCASCVEIISFWVSSTEIIWKLRIKAWQREVAVIKSCVFLAYPRRSSGDLYQRVAT